MGKTKHRVVEILLILALGVYPFGQLPATFFQGLLNNPFRVEPLDVVAGSISLFILFTKQGNKFTQLVYTLIAVVIFSALVAYFVFGFGGFSSLLYLLRLTFYLLDFLVLFDYFAGNKKSKQKVLMFMLISGSMIAILGWVQYFAFPDLRTLKALGWDDHYFRLVSTLVDPAFTGIVLTLTSLVGLHFYIKTKNRVYLFLVLFVLVTLAFTYSRASMAVAMISLIYYFGKTKKAAILFLAIFLSASVLLLPKSAGGEGVNLSRTNSITQKWQNYKDSVALHHLSPVFGVGYDNICSAKKLLNIDISKQTNSCNGLDNSYLFVLATTGFAGFFCFINLGWKILRQARLSEYSTLWAASALAVGIHALFTNTLFYIWVLFWMVILSAISLRIEE